MSRTRATPTEYSFKNRFTFYTQSRTLELPHNASSPEELSTIFNALPTENHPVSNNDENELVVLHPRPISKFSLGGLTFCSPRHDAKSLLPTNKPLQLQVRFSLT